MMSSEQIVDLSIQVGRKAARAKKEPYNLWPGDKDQFPPFPFPNIGAYRPKGFRLVQHWMVDKTGFGKDSEPALTTQGLIDKLRPGYSYALIEEGEFQVVVGEFERIKNGQSPSK